MTHRFISLFFLSIVTIPGLCRGRIDVDSLQKVLVVTNSNIEKIRTLNKLMLYYNKSDIQQSLKYGNQCLELAQNSGYEQGLSDCYNDLGRLHAEIGNYVLAIRYLNKSLKIKRNSLKHAEENNLTKEVISQKNGIADNYNNFGIINMYMGNNAQALEYYQKATDLTNELLKISRNENNQAESKKYMLQLSACYNNIGIVNSYLSNYPKALEFYQKTLKIAEELGDKKQIAPCYLNIAYLFSDQGNYNSVLEYLQKSLAIYQELNDKDGIADCCNNIGGAYLSLSNYQMAREYYLKALQIFEELNIKIGIADCVSNLGIVYMRLNNNNSAMDNYYRALSVYTELDDKNGIASVFSNIAEIQIRQKNYSEAVKYAEKGLVISRETKSILLQRGFLQLLSAAYDSLGDSRSAMHYYKLFRQANDSIFSIEKNKQITEMDTKYQTEKKEQQIRLQQTQLEKKEIEVRRRKMQRDALIGGLVLFSLLIFFVIRAYRIKRKANILLAIKNTEINQQKEEIQSQRDLVVQQRDLISEQNSQITKSIRYAFRIQSAVIPSEEAVAKILHDFFILYMPRDIVSGDFYWVGEKDKKVIILAADCTGHGIPGAFMSMLGVAFLNEIVNRSSITSPGEILSNLREKIVEALMKHGKEESHKDGMDVVALTIYPDENKMGYAGANNPLYLVKNNEMIEFKGNRMPVAAYDKMDPFTEHSISLTQGDCLYIFSDGYEDQFGGPKGKKFMSKNLKQLIQSISINSMSEQKQILLNTFNEWKGAHEQVDDVLLIGIRV